MILCTHPDGTTHVFSEAKAISLTTHYQLMPAEDIESALDILNRHKHGGGYWQQDTEYIEGIREP